MQRRSMFSTGKKQTDADVVKSTTSFVIDKKAKRLKDRSSQEKMLSALRKVLADMGDKDVHGCRYYIHSNKVQVLKAPSSSPSPKGEPQTYFASGRFVMGILGNHGKLTTKNVEFVITFKDTVDSHGLPDVKYIEPTHIDDLTGTPVKMVDLS